MNLRPFAKTLSFFLIVTTNAWAQDLNPQKTSSFWKWSKKVELTQLAVGPNRLYYDSFGGNAWDIILDSDDRKYEWGQNEADDVAISADGEIYKALVRYFDKTGKEMDYRNLKTGSSVDDDGVARTLVSIYRKTRRDITGSSDKKGPNYDLIKNVDLPNDKYDRVTIDILKNEIHLVKMGFADGDENHVVYNMDSGKISISNRKYRPRSSVQPSDKMLGDYLGLKGRFVVLPNGNYLAFRLTDNRPGGDFFEDSPEVKVISPDLESVSVIDLSPQFVSVSEAYVDASGVLYLGGTNAEKKSIIRKLPLR